MPTSPLNTYNIDELVPMYPNIPAPMQPVKLAASLTLAKGTLLGEKIGGSEQQSLTINATGGVFTITHDGDETADIAYNATAAVVQAALEALDSIADESVSVEKARSRWTLTLAGGTDGGTFAVRVTKDGVSKMTAGQAWNVSAANLQTAIRALGADVGASAMTVGLAGEVYTLVFPASVGDVLVEVMNDTTNDGGVWEGGIAVTETDLGGVYLINFQNALGHANAGALTTDATGLTGGAGTAVVADVSAGSAGTRGTFAAYDPDATDGTQIPKAILKRACTTDGSGNITEGGNLYGITSQYTDVYMGGSFLCADLVGLDDNAVALLNGLLLNGTVDDGVFKF